MRHPCSVPHWPLIRAPLQWVPTVHEEELWGNTAAPPLKTAPWSSTAGHYLLWPQPSSFLLLQKSSRVSSTLESLSPSCQLINVKWVLKLEVLVDAQPQLGRRVRFFSPRWISVEMGCALALCVLLPARWFPNWA